MSVLDLLSVIFYNLKRRKDRVLLTGLGVVIGSASVVLMVSLSSGLQRGATSQFGRLSDLKRIEVYPGMGQMMMMGGGGGENNHK
jgi:putative ABC transport system permease protein